MSVQINPAKAQVLPDLGQHWCTSPKRCFATQLQRRRTMSQSPIMELVLAPVASKPIRLPATPKEAESFCDQIKLCAIQKK